MNTDEGQKEYYDEKARGEFATRHKAGGLGFHQGIHNIDNTKDFSLVNTGSIWDQWKEPYQKHPMIAAPNNNNTFPKSMNHLLHQKPVQAIKQLLSQEMKDGKVEIIYRITKDPQSDIQPEDRLIKEVYGIEKGELVYLGQRDGRYVKPQPASYSFDE